MGGRLYEVLTAASGGNHRPPDSTHGGVNSVVAPYFTGQEFDAMGSGRSPVGGEFGNENSITPADRFGTQPAHCQSSPFHQYRCPPQLKQGLRVAARS